MEESAEEGEEEEEEDDDDDEVEERRQPIVADSFETEAKREVVASKGLGGGAEAETSTGQISLSVKASQLGNFPSFVGIDIKYRFDIRSHYHPISTIYLSHHM